jgi:transposase InsO family protein
MCELLGVNRSAYYDWCNSAPSERTKLNEQLAEEIKSIFIENHSNYGARRIRKALQTKGFMVSRRRISKIMKKQNLVCKTKRRFKVTTDSNHDKWIAPNLLDRNFTADKPNQKYVGDITYIWTQEGWLYLATVIDLYSRQVVGWSMQDHMQASLVNDALLMALWKRKPAKGLLWHTDRGSQYASDSHRTILKEHGVLQSMSRKGNCWDNAVAESFFHTLKTELTHHINFKTKEEAKLAIVQYIEVYFNRKRLHSANDYMSPMAFEMSS